MEKDQSSDLSSSEGNSIGVPACHHEWSEPMISVSSDPTWASMAAKISSVPSCWAAEPTTGGVVTTGSRRDRLLPPEPARVAGASTSSSEELPHGGS